MSEYRFFPTPEEYAQFIGTAFELGQELDDPNDKRLEDFITLVAATLWQTLPGTKLARLCYASLALVSVNDQLTTDELARQFKRAYIIDPYLPTGLLDAARDVDAEIGAQGLSNGVRTQAKVSQITAKLTY